MPAADSALASQVCLALVGEGPTHGWALVRLLAPTGEIGRIWSLSRPLVYRALDGLVDIGQVVRAEVAQGQGRERAIVKATAAGRRATRQWLDEPVEHLREMRTTLLLKLELRSRRGIPNAPLLIAQRDRLGDTIATLSRRSATDDPVALWRRETARAAGRFLDAALRSASSSPPGARLL